MEWKNWQNVPLNQRSRLPDYSGIYVVADANDFVWYVGQAVNLRNRWIGNSHHRYSQLLRSNRRLNHWIYWKFCPLDQLSEQEQACIKRFIPELNGCKVKTYLPKQSKQQQVASEIKRILKVLNRQTLLFPVIRSIIAGEYRDENGTRCILVIIHANDFEILANSASKRSLQIKAAWGNLKSNCGRDLNAYHERIIPVYSIDGQKIEFVEASEILRFLEDNLDVSQRFLKLTELLSLPVKALSDLTILDSVSPQEEYSFISDGKKTLTDAAYLIYRRLVLKQLNTRKQ